MLSSKNLRLLFEHLRLDRCVQCIEWIHYELDICFIHFVEKVFDPIIVPIVVDHYETSVPSCNKGGHKPLIKLIDRFQIGVGGFPFMLVDQIEGSVCYKLV
jgi:hypothetical protein